MVQEVRSISAGDIIYEKGKATETLNEIIINIEDWFIVNISKKEIEQGRRVNIKFTLRKTLWERIKDMGFLLAFLDNGGFYIGKTFYNMPTNENNASQENFNIDKCRAYLLYHEKILQLFEILNVTENLDMTVLTENDLRILGNLILAFVDKKPVNNLKEDLPANFYIQLGDVLLALYHYEKDGNKYIGDVFYANVAIGFDTDDKKHFVPVYAILDGEEWRRISNIDYASVFPAFEHFYNHHNDPIIFSVANNTLLSILLAFDRTQKPQLLELSIKLAKWILAESPSEELGKETSLINYLQGVARKQRLSQEDSQKLIIIAENSNVEECIRVGAYLLLENHVAAEMHFRNLDEEMQQAFKHWPIYHFWNERDPIIGNKSEK